MRQSDTICQPDICNLRFCVIGTITCLPPLYAQVNKSSTTMSLEPVSRPHCSPAPSHYTASRCRTREEWHLYQPGHSAIAPRACRIRIAASAQQRSLPIAPELYTMPTALHEPRVSLQRVDRNQSIYLSRPRSWRILCHCDGFHQALHELLLVDLSSRHISLAHYRSLVPPPNLRSLEMSLNRVAHSVMLD
ncbi:uncharacterized protein L969DRAFT_451567 [Mixia osmundae IAM 14324]|uniref:uncharacterized protein n=1 Tax=Mixia osmundae (strain CBS 9802 / IAM 14324 / JCM 22182 / KY 12970) TaxID=764103 RepID=UPI0004A556A0|nr:uncharacterized protein L969DRAFT_451567 [Mixia osmundae IAM 14324]KEI39487.1 hypothetical protein L969DRAFT_451567 [Mixia osmundae IAM 14324]